MPTADEILGGVIEAARADPVVGVQFILGVENAPLHDRFQRHLNRHADCYCEWPRGHGKTTQLNARLAWEIGKRPDIRIKMVQQTDPEAAKSVDMVRRIIRSERFRLLFPRLRLDPSDRGTQSLSVVEKGRAESFDRDSNIEACGVMGRAGGRADILVADDICDLRNSVLQPALRGQVKDAWKTNWLAMSDESRAQATRVWKVGTPYHVDDITAEWRALHGEDGSLLRCPVVDFVGPWPDVYTPEKLREKRRKLGPIAFARAYELVPVTSDMLVFQPDWLSAAYYAGDIPQAHCVGKVVGAVDFAFSDKRTSGKDDPDWSVLVVAWASSLGHLFVLEVLRLRTSFPEFRRRVNEVAKRRGVAKIYAEANGPQAGLVQEMREGSVCPVVGLERGVDKMVRASEQQAFVEQGRLHIPAVQGVGGQLRPRLDCETLVEEMLAFPAGSHDDCVDPVVDLMANTNSAASSSAAKVVGTAPAPLSRIYGAGVG